MYFPMRSLKYPIFCLLFVMTTFARADVQVVDDIGNMVSLKQPARRIISLSPHITEILFAAGAGQSIVGVVEYSDYPQAAKALPRIGNFNAFDLEAILALHPDLIVAWHSGNPIAPVEKLRRLGIPVFLSEPRALEDVATNLQRLGRLAGTESVADGVAENFLRELSQLRRQYQDKQPVSVFYQIWHRPLMTINHQHMISQAISLCGGQNVFADLPVLDSRISLEAVLAADPQVIIGGGVAVSYPQWKQDWRQWPQLQAVRSGNLFEMPADILQRQSPRILQGVKTLCEIIDQVRH